MVLAPNVGRVRDAVPVEPLTSIDAALAALQSARGATSGLGAGRKARRTARSKAHTRLLEATTQAIVTAEYLATLARVARQQQRQAIGATAATAAVELAAKLEFTARALQPLTRLAFGFSLATELTAVNALRVDLRQAFPVLTELVSASQEVDDVASDEVRAAAECLLTRVRELFAALPSPGRALTQALRSPRSGGAQDAAYVAALAAAWDSQREYRRVVAAPTGRLARLRRPDGNR